MEDAESPPFATASIRGPVHLMSANMR